MVKQLLTVDSVNVNSKDNRGQTALSLAVGNRREVMVKQLPAVDGVDINSKNKKYGQTALSWAAVNEHKALVGLLQPRSNPSL